MWKIGQPRHDIVEGTMVTYYNERFVCSVKDQQENGLGKVRHLIIARLDGGDGIAWDELQKIKNDLAGENIQALEIYPPEKHLVNTFPCRHLWCLMSGRETSFGYKFRATTFEGLLGKAWSRQ